MSENRATRTVVVSTREGIHARAATLIAERIRGFNSKVTFSKPDRERVEGTDVLQVLSLGAGQGEELELEAEGPDAEEVLEALVPLFAGRYDENQEKTGNPAV